MGNKVMPKIDGLETIRLSANDVRRGMRVRIADSNSKYFGDLGMISAVSEGCSCRDGWCRVVLDKNERFPEGAREEFRYGYRGDVSDLLRITKEPEREPISFLGADQAKVGAVVRIWIGSEDNYRDADRGDGKIITVEGRLVTIKFADGYRDEYRFGDGSQEIILITPAKPETAKEKEARLKEEREELERNKGGIGKKITPDTAKVGARVRIASDSEYKYQNKGIGTIKSRENNGEWVHVNFDDGYSNAYHYGLRGHPSDLILVALAPIGK